MDQKSKLHEIISSILRDHACRRHDGKVASDRTVTAYGEVLRTCFNALDDLGYKLQNPRNLNETHIKALCEYWHREEKKVTTMQEYLSKLRVFAGWIGKNGMVKSLQHYLPTVDKDKLVVKKAAAISKSWSEQGIDVAAKIQEADAHDWRFGLMIRMMLAFGLRRKEVLHTMPWKADMGDKLVIYPGEAKGGRPRDIYIYNEEQRRILDFVKNKIKRGERLGWPTNSRGEDASLKSNISKYSKCMTAIGISKDQVKVTGHGLRAQYAENAALIAHLIPPTLGGSSAQMNRELLNTKLAQVSELLGHSRKSVTTSYYGSFGRDVVQDVADRCKT